MTVVGNQFEVCNRLIQTLKKARPLCDSTSNHCLSQPNLEIA